VDVERAPSSARGIGVTASTGVILQHGATGIAAAGIDYFPYLYLNGVLVGFGVQVGGAVGHADGIHEVAPRLYSALPIGRLAGAPLDLGIMLRCDLAGSELGGCGPQLMITRAQL
jgi:hypothetical protein